MKTKIAYTIADSKNMGYAKKMINSLHKFHPDLKVKIYGDKEIAKYKEKYPHFFYMATPVIASELLKKYDLVLKLDADQIITGNLDFILNSEGWDIGTVYNGNPTDTQTYGPITIQGVEVAEYYNAGLVALQSKEFVQHWLELCESKYFGRFQYREQDLMNVLCHFGNYKVKCFDDVDKFYNYHAWHGLRSKGEWLRVKLEDDKLMLYPNNEGYPEEPKELKVLHWAGGDLPNKLNYRLFFTEDIIKRLDYLTSEDK